MGFINDLTTLILRSTVNPGYVNKGSKLTFTEGDENRVLLGDALKELRIGVPVNVYEFGETDDNNVVISFKDSSGNLGVIRYNGTTKLLEYAHDGATFAVLGETATRSADTTIVTSGQAVPLTAKTNLYGVIDNQEGAPGIDVTISGAVEAHGAEYLLKIITNTNPLNSINVTVVGGSYRATGGGDQNLKYWMEAGVLYGVWTKNGYAISN